MTTWKIISVVLGILSSIIGICMVIHALRENREPSLSKLVGLVVAAFTFNIAIGHACMYYDLP